MVKKIAPAPAAGTPGVVQRWVKEITLYEKDAGPWHEKGRKIVRRYKDERSSAQENSVRYNVLWSNIKTMLPACYGRNPKPEVARRFKDKDPVGRVASDVLERALEHCIASCDFKQIIRSALLDRLLPGRGLIWARYVPHMRDMAVQGNEEARDEGAQVTDDVTGEEGERAPASNVQQVDVAPTQEVYFEEVAFDYVHWEDFGHTPARTIDEMGAAWRKVFMTRDELIERFGDEIGSAVPLTYSPPGMDKAQVTDDVKKAVVYEIWDKHGKQALWICKDYAAQPLDTRADPLRLSRFFPFGRPMYSTLGNDSLIPVPDYRQYQDQASELDALTGRIASLTKAIKVAGVRDASAPGLDRLLSEGCENTLVPVEQWAAFAEKGGLQASIGFLPMKEIAETLLSLYEAREKVKADLYEITGMPDIIRGADDPRATATAQRIKGQFGSIRLRDVQDDVQRFVRDVLVIAGEIMAGHFGWQTLAQISGIKLLTAAEKQQLQQLVQLHEQQAQQQQAMQGQQPAQPPMAPPPQLPPIDPEKEQLLKEPAWEDVEALLRDNYARSFRIDIETDSTIGEDAELEQEQRLKMIETLGEFIAKAVQSAESAPQLAPVAAEMVMYVLRSFKNARSLESAMEEAMEKLVAMAANPQPKPNPDMAKVQGQLQIVKTQADADTQQAQQKQQFDMQLQAKKADDARALEMFKAQLAAQVDQAAQDAQQKQAMAQTQIEAQRDQIAAQNEAALAQMQAVLDRQGQEMQSTLQLILAHMNNATKLEVAEITTDTTLEAAQTSAAAAASKGDD